MEISRSEQKRQIRRLEELVTELAGLPSGTIDRIPCGEAVRKLIRGAAAMKGGARNRQIKYITKLLREEPPDEIYAFVTGIRGAALQEKKELHEVERYRDSILNEAVAAHRNAGGDREAGAEEWTGRAVDEVCAALPGVDRKDLSRLASLYARTRNRKYSRELFRILRAAHEQLKRKMALGSMDTER